MHRTITMKLSTALPHHVTQNKQFSCLLTETGEAFAFDDSSNSAVVESISQVLQQHNDPIILRNVQEITIIALIKNQATATTHQKEEHKFFDDESLIEKSIIDTLRNHPQICSAARSLQIDNCGFNIYVTVSTTSTCTNHQEEVLTSPPDCKTLDPDRDAFSTTGDNDNHEEGATSLPPVSMPPPTTIPRQPVCNKSYTNADDNMPEEHRNNPATVPQAAESPYPASPTEEDIFSSNGRTQTSGNMLYRRLIAECEDLYSANQKKIVDALYYHLVKVGGRRFFKKNKESGAWEELTSEKDVKDKIRQAFRDKKK